MFKIDKEIPIKIGNYLGASEVHYRGGSIEIALTKGMKKRYGIERSLERKERVVFMFWEAGQNGMLVLPTNRAVDAEILRRMIGFLGVQDLKSDTILSLLEEVEEGEPT